MAGGVVEGLVTGGVDDDGDEAEAISLSMVTSVSLPSMPSSASNGVNLSRATSEYSLDMAAARTASDLDTCATWT